jgi:uncharacterized membrane protein
VTRFRVPRFTAASALFAAAALAAAWLGPAALRAGPLATVSLLLGLMPLAAGIRGLLVGGLVTGRWLSLALPFYGAAFLVGAFGAPQARGWATAGAFCIALGFAATLSWVRRAAPRPAPRSRP